MTEMSIATFVVVLLLTIFVRRPWNWLLVFAGGISAFILMWIIGFIGQLAAIRAGSVYTSNNDPFVPVMWLSGFLAGSLVALLRQGHAQYKLKRTDWLFGVALTIAWLLLGLSAFNRAFEGNDDNLASAIVSFLLAFMSALTILIKPAITTRGIRAGTFDVVKWNEIESYEWRGNKLVLHLRARFLPRWLVQSSLKVASDEQSMVNRFLAQHLPDQQLPPPAAIRVVS